MTTRGVKAILGVAMAATVLLSILLAMPPMGTASTGDKNEITVGVANMVVIGQQLMFQGPDLGFNIVGEAPGTVEGVVVGTATDSFDSTLFPQAGSYYVDTNGNGAYDAGETTLSVAELTLFLKLVYPGTNDEITVITEGSEVELALTTNLPDAAQGDIKLIDPAAVRWLIDGAGDPLSNLVMGGVSDPGSIDGFTLDTTGFDKGDYEICVKTDPDDADGLSASSNTVTLTIIEEEIVLTADTENPAINEKVKFTVQGPPDTSIIISTDKPDISEMLTGVEDVPWGTPSWSATGEFLLDGVDPEFHTDEHGEFSFVMQFNDDQTVTITVENLAGTLDDDVDLDVQGLTVVLDVPSTVVIGEDLGVES